MVIRIDARQLKDREGLFQVFAQALGLPADTGKNLDALVDCLTHLDHPRATLAKVKVSPGEPVIVRIEHRDARDRKQTSVVRTLLDVIAFVNWRRLEVGEPAIFAPAYDTTNSA